MKVLAELSRATPVLIQGASGRMGRRHTLLMRGYGTNIVAGTSVREAGGNIEGIPLFADCIAAVRETGAVASVCMVPPLETRAAVEEAVEAGIRLIVTIAEGVPVHDALHLRRLTRAKDVTWIGASTPGCAIPGQVKLGFLPDVALRPGPVALLTKSGTLSYEVGYRLAALGLGQSTWIGVGGDAVKGTRFAELLPLVAAHGPTEAVILIGEVGGTEEEEFAEALARMPIGKPVLALLAGREAKEGVAMGHAGALTYGGAGTLASKTMRLQQAGAEVFTSTSALLARCGALFGKPA
jgi:succinyl-CoA synthetase alpha subunit